MRTRAALLLVVLAVAGCGAPAASGQPGPSADVPAAQATEGQPPASQPAANLPPVQPPPADQPPNQATGETGINGVTVVRSGCPMARAEPACPEKPVAALLAVMRTSDGLVVSKVESDANGQFAVTVPPGSYLLRPIGLVGGPGHDSLPMPIEVAAGRYTTVTVLVDSGLR
jgi:hypothetical protein